MQPFIFEKFASILKVEKRYNCELHGEKIDALCTHFCSLFILWDRAFLFARKFNSTREDVETYQRFIDAPMDGHVKLGLSITPKVHLMHKHV